MINDRKRRKSLDEKNTEYHQSTNLSHGLEWDQEKFAPENTFADTQHEVHDRLWKNNC